MQLLACFRLLCCNFHTSKKVEARTTDEQQIRVSVLDFLFVLAYRNYYSEMIIKEIPWFWTGTPIGFCVVWGIAHLWLLTTEIASDFSFFLSVLSIFLLIYVLNQNFSNLLAEIVCGQVLMSMFPFTLPHTYTWTCNSSHTDVYFAQPSVPSETKEITENEPPL